MFDSYITQPLWNLYFYQVLSKSHPESRPQQSAVESYHCHESYLSLMVDTMPAMWLLTFPISACEIDCQISRLWTITIPAHCVSGRYSSTPSNPGWERCFLCRHVGAINVLSEHQNPPWNMRRAVHCMTSKQIQQKYDLWNISSVPDYWSFSSWRRWDNNNDEDQITSIG